MSDTSSAEKGRDVLIDTNAGAGTEAKALPPLYRGIAVLVVLGLHNGWNAWTMLTMVADLPSEMELMDISESQVGTINTIITVSILVFLPVAMLIRWRRAVLAFGALVNLLPVPMRFLAARTQNYPLQVFWMGLQGFACSVVMVWPALIATTFFREERWAMVIAFAGLSNYAGGALGALITPIATGNTPEGLLNLLKLQAYFSIGLFVLTFSWLWIPAVQEESTTVSLKEEASACFRPAALARFMAFGAVVGVSITLQISNPLILQDSGFTTNQAGLGNFVYQFVACVVGVGVGSLVTQRKQLQVLLRWLHVAAILAFGFLLVVCVLTNSMGHSPVLFAAMVVAEALVGASVMGMLPFVTQELVYLAQPATENFITGFLWVIAMAISTITNYAVAAPSIAGVPGVSLLFAIIAVEVVSFAAIQCKWPDSKE